MHILLAFPRIKQFVALAAMLVLLSTGAKGGGEKFQLTLLMSPTAEWLRFGRSPNASEYNRLWGTKLSYSLGFEYKRFFDPSLSFSTGFLYMNKGFRNEVLDPLNLGNQVGVTLGSVQIAAVPLYLNIHHRLRRKTEMIYTAGLAGGYVMSQSVRGKNFTDEDLPEEGVFVFGEGKNNVRLFSDAYVGLHLGMGISTYLKSRLVLIVQPMYKRQLNNARDWGGQIQTNDPFTMSLNSFGIDFKMGYFFTRNIRNKKKEY